MTTLKIAICGFSGRMGQAIRELQPEMAKHVELVDFKTASSGVQVVIDFSNPEGQSEAMKKCLELRAPLVTGTTGMSADQKRELELAGKVIPVLWDANMSLGVQWLLSVLPEVSKLPAETMIQVEEVHHRHKKDAPSGTALEIQRVLQANRNEELPKPVSIRGGGVLGEHRVFMLGEEEALCFEHKALSRKVFARGALTAALWLQKQPKGFYRMSDLFKSK